MIPGEQPFKQTLELMVNFMTREHDSGPRGCLYAKMQLSPAKLGPKSKAHLQRIQERSITTYESWLRAAQARGEIADEICVALAAEFLHAQFIHILSQVAAGQAPERVRAQAQLAFAGLNRSS